MKLFLAGVNFNCNLIDFNYVYSFNFDDSTMTLKIINFSFILIDMNCITFSREVR